MKVSELIKNLQELDQDKEINMGVWDGCGCCATEIQPADFYIELRNEYEYMIYED